MSNTVIDYKRNYFKILGINEKATEADITKTYREKAKVIHPDKNPNDKKNAEAHFNLIAKAHEVLNDPKNKKLYTDNRVYYFNPNDALHQEVRDGTLTTERLDILLKNGARLASTSMALGTTILLHEAVSAQFTDIVAILLKKGVNVNQQDKGDQTPLLISTSNGHTPLIDLLLKNGANVNQPDKEGKEGRTPLSVAVLKSDAPNIKLLIQNGANLKHTLEFAGEERNILDIAIHKLTAEESFDSAAAILGSLKYDTIVSLNNKETTVLTLLLRYIYNSKFQAVMLDTIKTLGVDTKVQHEGKSIAIGSLALKSCEDHNGKCKSFITNIEKLPKSNTKPGPKESEEHKPAVEPDLKESEKRELEVEPSAKIKDPVALFKEMFANKAYACAHKTEVTDLYAKTLDVPGQLLGGSKAETVGDFKDELDYMCR